MSRTERFFKPMGKPKPYDWLGSHNEPGQTFDEYLANAPAKPPSDSRKIYILPLGTFSKEQERVIAITSGYLEAFYGLPVEKLPARTVTPTYPNVRYNNDQHVYQAKTGYFLREVLPPLLPLDGAALIAFTNEDLYPGETMSYVFGQADATERVGIWSFHRLRQNASAPVFLRRVLKIAVHETGHMFGMKHCTKYECVMSGTNQLAETDSRPVDACPECMAKVCWLSETLPRERYLRLAEFCRVNGLTQEAADFQRKASAVE